ncbi:MAG TPA: CopG family transcriptional regulator [Chloroflexota bacterium]|nr:CopG family transcriptional regulator [Chloroflexota bacterium]
MDDGVVTAVKQAVEQGAAPSQDAFVEKALQRELRRLRDLQEEAAWAAAAKDPEFQREMEEIDREFEAADLETWPPY